MKHKGPRWLILYLVLGVAWLVTKAVLTRDKPLSPIAIILGLGNPEVSFGGQVAFVMMGIVFPVVCWPLDIAMGLSVMPPRGPAR